MAQSLYFHSFGPATFIFYRTLFLLVQKKPLDIGHCITKNDKIEKVTAIKGLKEE